MFELGVDTLCYHRQILAGMPLDQVLAEVASLEVGWIQINRYHLRGEESLAQVGRLGRRARELGLRVIWSGDSLGQASWELPKGLESIQTGVQQAVAAGAPILRMFSSWFRIEVLASGSLQAEMAYLRELLGSAVPVLEQKGVVLGLENHSNLLATELAQLVNSVGSAHVRVHYDLVNPVAVFEDPRAAIPFLGPFAISGHVKDLVASSVWGAESYYRLGFDVRYVWPGEGILPLAQYLKTLSSNLSVSTIPLTLEGLDEPANPTEKARHSLDFLRCVQKEINAE